MDNKLSELSKPVAYKFDHGVMGPGDFKYGTPQMHSTAKDENASPLYSQEYVSALLAYRDAFEASALAMMDEWRARGERICALDAAIKRITELTQRQDTTNCSAEPQTVLYRWKNPGKMNWFTSPFPPLDNRVEVEELIVRPKHG